MKIDNFALTMHQTCPAKFHLRMEQGWTTRRKSGALGFGAALHSGLAAWYGTQGEPGDRLRAALEAIANQWPADTPVDDWRTLDKCVQVMIDYGRNYPAENFNVLGAAVGAPIVEKAFTLDTGMFLSCASCGPEAGVWDGQGDRCKSCGALLEPIEYGGILDTGVDSNGVAYVLEHKTTTQLGSYYFYSYKPNNQITGYVWALGKLSNMRVGGAIINAIGLYKSSKTKFERHITSRNPTDIQEWLNNVRATCEEIQFHRRTGTWPMRTSACTLYGLCEYHSVHSLSTDRERLGRLETDYVREPWDYERRDP